ncbi:Ig-like domain-containing protein (plasmid) [Pseudocitrobacter faecalis]|nr:Ig-like domain-containing protein [Pseudocitrobacter faecalis]
MVGKTVQLSAGITMSKGAGTFTWKSADDKVASVECLRSGYWCCARVK